LRVVAVLDRASARGLPVGAVPLPLLAGDRGLDREGELLVASGCVEALGGADETRAGLLERLPHLRRRAAVLVAQAVLPGDDDARSLATLAGVDRFPEGALSPGLRPGDVLLDDLSGERDAVRARPGLNVPALLVDRDRAFLRAALAHVRNEGANVASHLLSILRFTSDEGNRPSFSHAARPERAERLYEAFCGALEDDGVDVARGLFGARMSVEVANDGPVTIIIET
jgi:D-Tyr-tRNA(Tyr) deacylase